MSLLGDTKHIAEKVTGGDARTTRRYYCASASPRPTGSRTTALPQQSALAIHHQPTGSAQSKARLTPGSSFWFGLSGAAGS